MMEISKEYKIRISEKLMDLGNLSLVRLSFVSFIGKEKNIIIIFSGILLWVQFYIISLFIGGKN